MITTPLSDFSKLWELTNPTIKYKEPVEFKYNLEETPFLKDVVNLLEEDDQDKDNLSDKSDKSGEE
jgi:hypothetical protein